MRKPSSTLNGTVPLLMALGAALGCTGFIDGSGGVGTAPAGSGAPVGNNPTAVGGSDAGVVAPEQCAAPPVRIWKLTPDQYGRSVEYTLSNLAVSTDQLKKTSATVGAFKNDAGSVDLAETQMEVLLTNATNLATQVVARASDVSPCLATRPATTDCVRETVKSFGQRAFRRPLKPEEIDTYVQFHEGETQAADADMGLRQLFRAFFMSPHFLYRTELGTESAMPGAVVDLTGFERASALAYFITDGPPDASLMVAAERGELATPAQLEAQARRLLSTPEGARGVVNFFAEQLQTDRVLGVTKEDESQVWTTELAADMAVETRRFVEHAVFHDTGTLAALLTGKTSFLNSRLAALYGVAGVVGTDFVQSSLPDGRMGLLGQGSFLAAFAHPDDTDIVRRGRFIRERLLCQSIPAPPPDLADIVIPPKPDGVHTQRQRIAIHSADPGCAGCHDFMDPLGFGLESFDALGRYRTHGVDGQPIDSSGVVVNVEGGSRTFNNFAELAQLLAELPEVASCVTGQLYTYANGRPAAATDACAVSELNEAFVGSGNDLRELVVKLVSSDAFVKRTN